MKATASLVDILNFGIAYQRLFGDGNPSNEQIAPPQHANASCRPSFGGASNQTCVPRILLHPAPHQAPPPDRVLKKSSADDDDGSPAHLKVGSRVEIYADTSVFASPAVITGELTGQTIHSGLEKNPSSTKYNLHQLVDHFDITRMDPEFIHPYSVYEDGTKASCNVSKIRNKAWMLPCTVVGNPIENKGGFVLYEVQYVHHVSNQEVREYLPFDMVQRLHTKPAAIGEYFAHCCQKATL